MSNFLLTFSGGGMPESEEDQKKVMEAWGAWYGALGESVVDPGAPVGHAQSISGDGSVSQGAASNLSGYTIISAGDRDEAVTKAKGCPILTDGGTVEVHEAFDMGDMG